MPPLEALLSGVPYLQRLPAEELEHLRRRAIAQTFPRGRIIFLERDPCAGLYLIDSGRVKLFKTSADGREQILRLVGPGGSFNDVAAFDGGDNPTAAAAMDRVALYLLPSAEVQAVVLRHPDTATALIQEFARRLREMADLVEDLSFRHVTSRVAKLLLQYADQRDGPNPRTRLTQQELAAMVGSVREVVGRSLAALEREGAIRIDRARIVITNRDVLRRLA
ncbi:MAG TPA: Crp/Fnr family transcriptional regulator [Chloroflexota bacterium]|nr:Crp/Fnr family transcriptional regulator [Chloroflexota bacterium]